MKSLVRHAIVGSVALAIVGAGTYFAWAQWIIPSPVTAKVKTVQMPRGGTPSAAMQSGKAVVSWSAQEIVPDVLMTGYVVTAHDTESPAKPDVARTVAASGAATESTTFTAAELAGGKWKWAIVPKFHNWAGGEGKLSNPKLVFPAIAPAPAALVAVGSVPATVTPSASPSTSSAPEATPVPTATSGPASAPETTTAAPPTTAAPVRSTPPPPAQDDPVPSSRTTEGVVAKAGFGVADPSVSPSS